MQTQLSKTILFISSLGLLACYVAAHSHSHSHSHSHAHHSDSHGHSHHGGKCKSLLTIPDWLHEAYDEDKTMVALSASLLTSFIPILILLFCPSQPSRGVLQALLAFAAGSLLGDALLHLLPHSMVGEPVVDPHSELGRFLDSAHVSVPHLLFLMGIFVFLLLEKLLRLAQGEGHSHSHSHSHTAPAHRPQQPKGKRALFQSAAVLNLIADMSHNFTDGITIAAGFAHSLPVGVSTTIAVFVHEIPHEVGDYAVLVSSGFGKSGAFFSQIATGVGNLAGAVVMMYADKWIKGADQVVLSLSAGGFVYIATVGILPELLQSQTSLSSIFMEMVMLCLGVMCMVAIGFLE